MNTEVINNLKILKKYSNLLNPQKIKTLGFDRFTKIIKNKFILRDFASFLSPLLNVNEKKKLNITTRKFMTSFVIISFPQYIFSNQVKDVDDLTLINLAIELTNFFNLHLNKDEINEKDLYSIKLTYIKFSSFFDKWKKKDVIKIVLPFANSYSQLKQTLVDIEASATGETEDIKQWRQEIEKQQEKILQQVKKIGGENAENFVKNYEPPKIVLDDKIYKQISQTVKKAYWDKFKEDLDSGDFSLVISLLKDIREIIFSLISNRQDLQEQFKNKLDYELIEQMINHNAIKVEDVYNIAIALIDYLKMLQASIDDRDTEEWCNSITELFYKETITYGEILPAFFCGIFDRLEKIKERLIEFYKKIQEENK